MFQLPQGLKQYVFVETAVSVSSFPVEMRSLKSIIHEHLEEQNLHNIAEQYCLREFSVRTQTLDRTLIDKLYALGDYYLSDKISGHSRHVYDIYKLLPLVAIDDNFRNLVKQVREVRRDNKFCLSAHDDIDMQKLLEKIAEKDTYKKDYEDIETALIYEDVSYSMAKEALLEIIGMSIF